MIFFHNKRFPFLGCTYSIYRYRFESNVSSLLSKWNQLKPIYSVQFFMFFSRQKKQEIYENGKRFSVRWKSQKKYIEKQMNDERIGNQLSATSAFLIIPFAPEPLWFSCSERNIVGDWYSRFACINFIGKYVRMHFNTIY